MNLEVTPTEREPPKKPVSFATASEEERTKDECDKDVLTVETTNDEEDPLALGPAEESPPSATKKDEFRTEDSDQIEASGQQRGLPRFVVKVALWFTTPAIHCLT